jgi:hypothetical protein
MVLRAGTFTSLGSRLRRRSRILRTPQFGSHVWPLRRFDLLGQLVGIAAPGTIREPLQSAFLIMPEDLVASLAGNLKLAAQRAMLSPSLSRITNRMRSSLTELSFHWHPTSRPLSGEKM